jgi:hypothetical protein
VGEPFRAALELSVGATPTPVPALRFDALASAALELPGLSLSVDDAGIGIALRLDLSGQGALAFLDVALEPRPPAGAGARLEIPGVSGGGYLARVDDELRGMVSANLGFVRVTGFGILGTDEFSLLVLLAAEFMPPIQLSFGFTLVGVGGIVGINRRADVEAIGAAVSSGDLSRLLFPRDPVGEAPRLLGTLSACFPYEDGGIVIGPFVKVGWGTPTIASATVGVIVSTANGGVAIVGRLAVSLPFEDIPIVHIEATFVATIDAEGFALDASLANSYLAGITIQGDLRIRIRGGSNSLLAISAGGFHPSFTPPAGMAGMRRIGADLSPGPILRLRLEAYAAITSSSLQFGARVELRAGIDGFGITGSFAFDALFVTEPSFGFVVALSASISVVCFDFEVAAVHLSGELAGPSPWRIRGSASISILFFDVDVDIPTIEWGSAPVQALPARDPLEVIRTELARPEAWTAGTAAVPVLVVLAPGVADDASALHPLAGIEFRQRAIPLATELPKVDGRTLPRPVTVSVTTDEPSNPVREPFVPSSFFDVAADRQLASAGFVDLPAGVDFGRSAPAAGHGEPRDVVYEQRILEDDRRFLKVLVGVDQLVTAVSTAVLAAPAPVPFVDVLDPIASIATVAALTDVTASVTDRAGALSTTEAWLAVDRATADGIGGADLQVVAAWEVA